MKPSRVKKNLDDKDKIYLILNYLILQLDNKTPRVTAHDIATASIFPTTQKPDHIKYYLIDLEKIGLVASEKEKNLTLWEITPKGKAHFKMMKELWESVFSKPNQSI
jgi:DNA-binding PadR family transcriptional regulator